VQEDEPDAEAERAPRAAREEAAALLPRFIAEIEAEWPPLDPLAWDEPEEDEEEADACPEPGRSELPALPPPAAEKEPEENGDPRERSLKDEEW